MEQFLPDVGVLADEGFRDFCFFTVAENFERSASLLSSTFLRVKNLAFVSLCAEEDDSVELFHESP